MSWEENQREQFEEDIIGHLIDDQSALADFVVFMTSHNALELQKIINAWLETPEGKKFFTETLEKIIENKPENDEDPREDR